MKKAMIAMLVFFFTLGLASSAFAEPKTLDEYWSNYTVPPLGMDDFVIRVGKTDINLLTCDVQSVINASGKQPKKQTYSAEGEEWIDYVIKAKEATFTIPGESEHYYINSAALTKKGVSARGIKIGSKESALLAAYPEPHLVDEWGKYRDYTYRIGGAPKALTDSDLAHLDDLRPSYFYEIHARVSIKTKKVAEFYIVSAYFD